MSHKKQDFLAAATFSEVEATDALGMKCSQGKNGGPKDRCKSSINVNSWVQIGNRFQET